jgi:hypothetical protein
VELTDNPIVAAETSASTSSSSSGSLDVSLNDAEIAAEEDVVISMANPNKIRRTFPLRKYGQDPAQCYDLLDSMYEIYYETEVGLAPALTCTSTCLTFEIGCAVLSQAKYAAVPYMHTQEDLNNKMRSILVDWLVEVHHKFKLFPSSLWLCVNIIDRYLMKATIKRAKLQLVGISAFFIACKFEEVYPPEAKDFVHITDNAYSRQELLAMETEILNTLEYHILVPTGYNFLTRYLNAIRAGENTRLLASYYAERNLQEPHMLDVKPRVFAAAAVYAALTQQSQRYGAKLGAASVWCRQLQEESNLTEEELLPCARNIVKHVKEEPITTSKRKLIAAKKKYQHERNMCVAQLELPVI